MGEVYAKWTVIAKADKSPDHNNLFMCRCVCGNESILSRRALATGLSKSCGKCNNAKLGEVYGQLTVVEEAGKDSANRRRLKCQCSCGKEKIVDAYTLTSGLTKTCGNCNETTFRTNGEISYGLLADRSEFWFDTKNLNFVQKFQWHCDADGYVKTSGFNGKRTRLLHRILLKASSDKVVDHIDGNPKNNCIENLRLCSRQENVFNQKVGKANKTGYTGVYQIPNGKYLAYIGFNRKIIYLGRLPDLQEAALIRNEAAKLLFGNYARLNGSMEAPAHIKKFVYEKCKEHLVKQQMIV